MAINPFRPAGRRSYSVSFRHPVLKRPVNRSLATDNFLEAREIALAVERYLETADSWDPSHPSNADFPLRAQIVFHGKPASVKPPTITVPDLLSKAVAVPEKAPRVEIENDAGAELQRELSRERADNSNLKMQLESVQAQLQSVHRRYNTHVKITLGEAEELWAAEYSYGRSRNQTKDCKKRVAEFVKFVGASRPLRDVKGADVDAWLKTFTVKHFVKRGKKLVEHDPLAPPTLQRRKALISAFCNWYARQFEMTGSIIEHTHPLAGVSRTPEQIVCIRSVAEIDALLKALALYWRAVAAIGCLSGLRAAEIIWLKKEDLFLDQGFLRVTHRIDVEGEVAGTKTGREDNVPIEKTRALAILRDFVKTRGAGSWRAEWPWCFPTLLDEGSIARTLTPAGLWSHNSSFNRTLDAALLAAEEKGPKMMRRRKFWTYGPWHWRHTAGTAMGMSGMSELQISRVLRNSPDVCRRHYIGVRAEDAGARWPFQW